ncbi:MAG TPA: hypothetical protein VKU61_03880 [Candidatus Binatia bacterium]|nr:hypothetical protein [Candidatus Binatia bacterium]
MRTSAPNVPMSSACCDSAFSAMAGWLCASEAGTSASPFTSPSQSGMNPASSLPPAQVTSR